MRQVPYQPPAPVVIQPAQRTVHLTQGLPPLRGWWESLAAADFNGDGRTDIAAGNLGLNHTYTTSPEHPFGVVAVDMTGNRTTDIILTKQIEGTETPLYGLAKLGREIYTLGIAFDSFESFSKASIRQVVPSDKLEQALRYQADTFASVVLLSQPDGSFQVNRLPNMAQISPIHDMLAADLDGDGHTDLLAAGNLYESEPTAPRADAGNGLWMRGHGNGTFTPVGPMQSGLLAPGDVRDMALVNSTDTPRLIITNNADSTQVFKTNRP